MITRCRVSLDTLKLGGEQRFLVLQINYVVINGGKDDRIHKKGF